MGTAADELIRYAAVERAAAVAPSVSDSRAGNTRLLEAIRSIGGGQSLSQALEALANGAALEAGRAAILLIREERFVGWRFVGFGPGFESAGTVEISPADAGIVADAARTGETTSADGVAGGLAPSFAQLAAGQESVAVPLVMGGQAVAVLYADQGTGGSSSGWQASVEVLARYAARCLEALTAIKAARVMTERAHHEPSGDAEDAGADDAAAARRYARLLVSEIRLYHELEVVAGRRERDLATRLGGEIARARALYEQRVSEEARRRADYFHEELVRTLADGDGSLLEVRN